MISAKLAPSNRLVDSQLARVDKHRINGHFVRGPIPLSWISKAARLPGKSINAGLACFYLKGLKKSHIFKLSNGVASNFGNEQGLKGTGFEAP